MPGERSRRAAVGIGDQMLYSLTNFALTILVARYSSAAEFGRYAVLVATFLIASAVNRGLTSEPLIIRFSAADESRWRAAARDHLSLALVWGCVAGSALLVVTVLALPSGFTQLGLAFAAAMPVLFVQDYLRYAALARGRPVAALVNDVVVVVAQAALAVGVLVTGHDSAVAFVLVWILAGGLGAAVGLVVLRLRLRLAGRRRMLGESSLQSRLGLDNFITQVTQQSTAYLVAAVAGVTAAGGLRAAQTLYTPPSVLSLGVQSAVTPELVRLREASLRRMRRVMYRSLIGLTLASSVYFALALLIPASLGTALFGASWVPAQPLLVFVGIGMVAGSAATTAIAGLRALADGRRTLRARTAAIVITLGTVVPGAVLAGAKGASIGVAVGVPLQAVVWWAQFAISYRAARAEVGSQRVQRQWQRLLDSVDDAGGTGGLVGGMTVPDATAPPPG